MRGDHRNPVEKTKSYIVKGNLRVTHCRREPILAAAAAGVSPIFRTNVMDVLEYWQRRITPFARPGQGAFLYSTLNPSRRIASRAVVLRQSHTSYVVP